MKLLSLIIPIFAASTIASGAVATGNILLSANPGFGPSSDYALTVFQDAEATDPTSIVFNYIDSQLIFVTTNIDEASDWYLGELGSVFSATRIANGEFTLFTKADGSGFTSNPIDVSVGSFYLGVNTGNGFTSSEPNREVFGWVKLESDGEILSLLASGVTYTMPGIVVGTLTTVPEPASAGVYCSVVSILVALNMRRRNNKA